MNAKSANTIYLIAVAVTVLLVGAYHLLPQKRHLLLPNPQSWVFTSDDSEFGGASHAEFLEAEPQDPRSQNSRANTDSKPTQDFGRWQCALREGFSRPACSIGITLARSQNDWTKGTDFSGYDTLKVKIRYSGPAPKLRLHFRNFETGLSSKENYNSAKFIKVNIRTSDLSSPLSIKLSEFQVADWWIDQFNVPRKISKATFDRITTLGIDFADPPPLGDHLLEFEQLEFVGSYISAEHWYLGILVAWMAAIAATGAIRLHELGVRNRQDARRLREMSRQENELKRDTKAYLALSKTDALTGTLNRFGLQEIIDVSFEWRKPEDELALLIIDLDLFKRVNDTYGHGVGDQVLIKTGQLLNRITRCVDTVARWGGEEFIVMCPHTSMSSALIIAEKIRTEIENTRYPEHEELRITTSLGVTQIRHTDGFDDAFKRADEALYKAKKNGRNVCVVG